MHTHRPVNGQWKQQWCPCSAVRLSRKATPSFLPVRRNIGRSWQKVVAFHWPATVRRLLPSSLIASRHRRPQAGRLCVRPDHIISRPSGVKDGRKAGQNATCALIDVLRCGMLGWWCVGLRRWIVFRDVDFVLSRRRQRLCEPPTSVTESCSASLSLCLYVSLSVSLSVYEADRPVTCDVTCRLIASLHITSVWVVCGWVCGWGCAAYAQCENTNRISS